MSIYQDFFTLHSPPGHPPVPRNPKRECLAPCTVRELDFLRKDDQVTRTFLLYYLPAYYFAVLAFGKLWHECACVHLRPTVCLIATIALCGAIGRVAWYLSPIAYGSKVLVQEWNDRLRYASTECWPYSFPQEPCWVDVDQKE